MAVKLEESVLLPSEVNNTPLKMAYIESARFFLLKGQNKVASTLIRLANNMEA